MAGAAQWHFMLHGIEIIPCTDLGSQYTSCVQFARAHFRVPKPNLLQAQIHFFNAAVVLVRAGHAPGRARGAISHPQNTLLYCLDVRTCSCAISSSVVRLVFEGLFAWHSIYLSHSGTASSTTVFQIRAYCEGARMPHPQSILFPHLLPCFQGMQTWFQE